MGSETSKPSAPLLTGSVSEIDPQGHRATKHKPALVTWVDTTYCLFLGTDDKLWFTSKSSGSTIWEPCVRFAEYSNTTGAPALGVYNNTLHAVISRYPDQPLVHYQYETSSKTWGQRAFLGQHAGGDNLSPVSLIEYNGSLCCAYNSNDGNIIHVLTWNQQHGWTDPIAIEGHWTRGEPSLYVVKGRLRMLYISADDERRIKGLLFNEATKRWDDDVCPSETSRFGLTTTSVDPLGLSWVVFQTNADSGQFGVCQYLDNSWSSVLWTPLTSTHTPVLAVSNDELICVWSSRDGCVLKWTKYPLNSFWNTSNWMGGLPSQALLSSLTIPGTHESCSRSFLPWLGCQSLSVTEQCNMGIRAFDFRVGNFDGVLLLRHGSTFSAESPRTLKLETVLNDLYSWLDNHKNEALIVQIKEEGGAGGTMPLELWKLISSNNHWVLNDTPPTLGSCRQKIQLLRRFYIPPSMGPTKFGIDVDVGWHYNDANFTMDRPGMSITVQDHCEADSRDSKWGSVETMLNKAKNETNLTYWFINYTSASTGWLTPHTIAVLGSLNPNTIASYVVPRQAGINERIQTYFAGASTKTRYGTIMMDYPESEPGMIHSMIRTNFV